jgi:hypothetical protein
VRTLFLLLITTMTITAQEQQQEEAHLADLLAGAQQIMEMQVQVLDALERVEQLQERILLAEWPGVSQMIAGTYVQVLGRGATTAEMDDWQSRWLREPVLQGHVVRELVDSGEPLRSYPVPVVQPPVIPEQPAGVELQIGNFLAENAAWTSMTLRSDYLHNGTTPNRAASDVERVKIIERARGYGNTFHLYAVNDTNYSRRRGNSNGWWDHIPDRRLLLDVDGEFDHCYHWSVSVRAAGMDLVVWLWPNDAVDTYNKESVWGDDRVVEQMARTIRFFRTLWNGEPLARDFVLKLEGDDEWSVARINRISARVRGMLQEGERLWYHNQTNDLAVLRSIDWGQFHGVRYQWMNAPRMTDEQFVEGLVSTIEALPGHLLWVGSEYTVNGDSVQARGRGDLVLSLRDRFPQIIGVDNGANLEKWGMK